MITLPNTDDDEISELLDLDDIKPERQMSVVSAIGTLALQSALDRTARRVLKRHPVLSIVHVPDAAWADIVKDAVKRIDRAPTVRTITERTKVGGVSRTRGADDLAWLRAGNSVMFVTQDPSEMLDETVLAASDITITIPPMSPELLRRVINKVTGGRTRGITTEMARLDVGIISSVIRPGLTARQCTANLQRAVDRQPKRDGRTGPLLSELPLSRPIRDWADGTLSDLIAVRSGSMAPDQLVFGVLEGPPGTGKTILVEALARSADWAFIPSSVGAWFTVGDGALGGVAKNVKGFIDTVLASEPAVGFLDELDAIPNRETMDNKGRDWWTPIVNLCLVEIDRLRKSGKQVILLAATNHYNQLDTALIRPGRLAQRVPVLPPQTEQEAFELLGYFLGDDLCQEELGKLARFARGATPAAVEGWSAQARARARTDKRPLAFADVLAEMTPPDGRKPSDIRLAAIHEIGHAVVAHRVGQTVRSVSILAHGDSGGMTETSLPSLAPTWAEVCDTATVALGGRAADIALGGGANAGAEADLLAATHMLRAAIEQQGLGKSLVHAAAFGDQSTNTRKFVDDRLRQLLERAISIIEADRDIALCLANRLIEERLIAGSEVASALGTWPANLEPRGRGPAEGERFSTIDRNGDRHSL